MVVESNVESVLKDDRQTSSNLIAMVWAPHEPRTKLFARLLNAPLFNVHYLKYKQPLYAPLKYPMQIFQTWRILLSQKPRTIYITNPPVFAPLAVYLYCKLFGARYVMDTHPPSLYMSKWAWTVPMQRWLARRAHYNVTDQERFKQLFESWGAKCLVLESPPKAVPTDEVSPDIHPHYFDVGVVNTFASDEPLDIILEAARQMPDVRFFITGDTAQGDQAMIESAPENCIFTGYLLGADYWQMLTNSRAVMTLTTYPHSLVQGAHDGMMLRKPLLLSRQPTLEEYYTKGTVFVENTAEGIVEGVREVQANEQQLIAEQGELVVEHSENWERNFQDLVDLIEA